MKINKFGGASIRDASGIKNVVNIIHSFDDNSIVVVSATGKSTNLLEKACKHFFDTKGSENPYFKEFKENHLAIIDELFDGKAPFVMNDIENILLELECVLEKKHTPESYDFYYDQIIPFGEIISSRILAHALNFGNVKAHWLDIRNFMTTDANYREARIDWDSTKAMVQGKLSDYAQKSTLVLQGFIGRSHLGTTTTLGREGSDYTAAILAHCLNAKSVTIWKDVSGVMNADPKKFDDAKQIDVISFNEAIELAYYGATVIHPKTIQPLKNKKIPLYVKSFKDPTLDGTIVKECEKAIEIPCRIIKENQCFITIKSRDLSFIAEDNLQLIFSTFAKNKLRLNVMQNSAISFACCTDFVEHRIEALLKELNENFDTEIEKDLKIYTTYNYLGTDVPAKPKNTILRQINGFVVHDVVKNKD
jgi:aspartate kinase